MYINDNHWLLISDYQLARSDTPMENIIRHYIFLHSLSFGSLMRIPFKDLLLQTKLLFDISDKLWEYTLLQKILVFLFLPPSTKSKLF